MKKFVVLVALATVVISGALVFGSNSPEGTGMQKIDDDSVEVVEGVNKSESGVVECFPEQSNNEMFKKAIDYIMNLDPALNHEMQYIAIDFDYEVDPEDKKSIITVFEGYDVGVFESSLEELSDEKYSDEFGNLYGLLVSFNNIDISERVTISFMKYKSGMGSISTEITLVQNENGEWEVEKNDAPIVAS